MHLRRLLPLWLAIPLALYMHSAAAVDAVTPEQSLSQTLLSTDRDWTGTPYANYPAGKPQLTVLRIQIPPHTALPWHTHPMPNAAYVLKGTLTVETPKGQQRTLHAGDVLPEMVNAVHHGFTGDEPVELIVFYAGVEGQHKALTVSPPPTH